MYLVLGRKYQAGTVTCTFQMEVGMQHQATLDCCKYTTICNKQRDAMEQLSANKVTFTVDGNRIENVAEFKYLGRILESNDRDVNAVTSNLRKARQKWGMIGRLLSKKDSNPRTMAIFYKTIVQSVLLYGSESWVLNQTMLNSLRSFHHRCARFITGRHIRVDVNGYWTYPSSRITLNNAGLLPIEDYIQKRKSTITNYARGRAIYAKCEASLPLASNPRQLVWWDNNIANDT